MQPSERENRPPHDEVLKISSGVAFCPFENITSFYPPEALARDIEIQKDYTGELYLRRKFTFNNVEGYLDVVDEDIRNLKQEGVNPYGKAGFGIEVSTDETGEETLTLMSPAILRICFFLKSQRDFVSLSNTGVSLLSDEAQYLLIHTYSPRSSEILHALDEGIKVSIAERSFSEIHAFIETVKSAKDPERRIVFDVSYLWLSKKPEDLRKIKLRFEGVGGNDDKDPKPADPPPSSRALVAV